MRRIAIVNMKGGVGKTTTAVHLAAGLAARGRRVLLVDTDPQGNVGHVFGTRPRATLTELLLGEAPLATVITREVRPNLDIILSTPAAFSLESRLAGTLQRETLLQRRLRECDGYDYVILDGSPAMNLLAYNALLYADEVVIPVRMDRLAIIGARQTLQGIREIRDLWPDHPIRLSSVLPVALRPETRAARAGIELLAKDEEIAPRLLRDGIAQCIDLTYAMAQHQTIWEYAPRSKAASDYTTFVDGVADGKAATQGGA